LAWALNSQVSWLFSTGTGWSDSAGDRVWCGQLAVAGSASAFEVDLDFVEVSLGRGQKLSHPLVEGVFAEAIPKADGSVGFDLAEPLEVVFVVGSNQEAYDPGSGLELGVFGLRPNLDRAVLSAWALDGDASVVGGDLERAGFGCSDHL